VSAHDSARATGAARWSSALVVVVGFGAGCASPVEPRVCNGHAELCARGFDEVAFAGSHNAMSSLDLGFDAPNQREDLQGQLELGVRAFLIDTHFDSDGHVGLCHESCVLGEIPIVDGLRVFRTFLDAHPSDVIQLLIEDYPPPSALAPAMEQAGLVELAIVHDPGTPWPTLNALIDDGKRVFIGTEHSSPPPAWNQAMYLEYVDTPFTFHALDDLAAPASCDRNRGSDDNALLLVNHWVEDPFPDESVAALANAHDTLLARALRCSAARRRFPNVIAVDFVGTGDLIRVVDELNGVAP
jgi:hypothetical protein